MPHLRAASLPLLYGSAATVAVTQALWLPAAVVAAGAGLQFAASHAHSRSVEQVLSGGESAR